MAYSGPTVSQSAVGNAVAATTIGATLNVAAKRGFVVMYVKGNATAGIIDTITDSTGETLIEIGSSIAVSSRRVRAFYLNTVASGSRTITVTVTVAADYAVHIFELSNYVVLGDISSLQNSTNTNTFHCSAATRIDTLANSLVFGMLALTGAVTTVSEDVGSGYTLHSSSVSGGNLFAIQYGQFEAVQTDLRSTFTTTGSAVQGPGKSFSFVKSNPNMGFNSGPVIGSGVILGGKGLRC